MLSRILVRLVLVLGRVLPVRVARGLATGLGRLVYLLPAARRGLLDNARHILGPQATFARRRQLALGVLESFAQAILDLILGERLWKHLENRPLEVVGRDNFDRATEGGNGFIALTLHLGSYEAGSRILTRQVGEVTLVYHRDPSRFFEELRSLQRRRNPVAELAIDRSPFFAIELRELLKNGGVALMAGEIAAGARGEPFRFFDGEARFSLWPARLAISAGVPILPAFTVKLPGGGFRCQLEPPVFPAGGQDPRRMMEPLVELFESMIRRYPDQWLMVRPFWTGEVY